MKRACASILAHWLTGTNTDVGAACAAVAQWWVLTARGHEAPKLGGFVLPWMHAAHTFALAQTAGHDAWAFFEAGVCLLAMADFHNVQQAVTAALAVALQGDDSWKRAIDTLVMAGAGPPPDYREEN